MSTPLGIYISVPFCKAKCTFCNFASGVFGADRMQSYVERVVAEIGAARGMAERLGAELSGEVDTVYFGGGTPSLLGPEQFREIFARLRGEFALAVGAEITLECAPGQLGEATLEELLRQGMNRMSFGVQSFVDRESAAVGRLHTEQMCREELARVQAAGVEAVNLDLIVGLPHQTEASWRYSLDAAVTSGVPHVSVYMLEVDEDSRLGKEMLAQGSRYSAGEVPSEDDAAAWYQVGCEVLGAGGLRQYEISNFARAGSASRHNMKYWQRQPYVGFGLDAHSMLRTAEGAVRFANTSELDAYLAESEANGLEMFRAKTGGPEVEVIGREAAFEEALFLGLRMNEGVALGELRREFGDVLVEGAMAAVLETSAAGLLALEAERLRLTDRGRMVSNEVFSRLLVSAVA